MVADRDADAGEGVMVPIVPVLEEIRRDVPGGVRMSTRRGMRTITGRGGMIKSWRVEGLYSGLRNNE